MLQNDRDFSLPVSAFHLTQFTDEFCDNLCFDLPPFLLELTVYAMTRFLFNDPSAFEVPLAGAAIRGALKLNSQTKPVKDMLKSIQGMDDVSLINALSLASYSVNARQGPSFYLPVYPDMISDRSVMTVRILIIRTTQMLTGHCCFGRNGLKSYELESSSRNAGLFYNPQSLWLFQTVNRPPDRQDIQVLLETALLDEFHHIKSVGILNPYLNQYYSLSLREMPRRIFDRFFS